MVAYNRVESFEQDRRWRCAVSNSPDLAAFARLVSPTRSLAGKNRCLDTPWIPNLAGLAWLEKLPHDIALYDARSTGTRWAWPGRCYQPEVTSLNNPRLREAEEISAFSAGRFFSDPARDIKSIARFPLALLALPS